MHIITGKTVRGNDEHKEMSSNRLPVGAFRASWTGVWAPAPSLLTCPPPSPTAHGHLQSPPKAENMVGWSKVLNVYMLEKTKKENKK